MNTTYITLIVVMNDVVKSDFITKRGSTYNIVHYMNVVNTKSDETFSFTFFFA